MQIDERILRTPRPHRPVADSFASGRTLLWFAAVAAVLMAFFPMLTQHARQVWDRPHYRFAPFAIFAAMLLAKSRLREVEGSETGKPVWIAVSISAAWGLLAVAVLFNSPRSAAAVFLLILASAAYAWQGRKGLVKSTTPLLLMAVASPFPFGLDWETNLSMQARATSLASKFLDALGIFHVLAGDVFESAGKRILVEDACSGINAVFASLAAALAYAIWRRRSPLHTSILCALVFPVILVTNALQVTAVCYLAIRCQFDLTLGVKHQFVGCVSFLAGLLLILSADNSIRFLLAPVSQGAGASGSKVVYVLQQLPTSRLGLACPIFIALGYGILAVGQWNTYLPDFDSPESSPSEPLVSLLEESLPAQWDRWTRTGFDVVERTAGSSFGEHSRTWRYRFGENQSTLSLDYPFPNWHEITQNYTSQGWLIVERPRLSGEESDFVEVLFSKPGHRLGHLLYAQYDSRGDFLAPQKQGLDESVHRHVATWDRLMRRLKGERAVKTGPIAPVYQSQMFTETSRSLPLAERIRLVQLFRLGTKSFVQTVHRNEP